MAPYCTDDMQRGCTIDRDAVGRCNLVTNNPPVDYQVWPEIMVSPCILTSVFSTSLHALVAEML